MFYYIKTYETHIEYIESTKQLPLKEITKEEYEEAIAAIRLEVVE